MAISLNGTIPTSLKTELDKRASDVKDRSKGFNYQKRAYVSISSTGNNVTALCNGTMTIGDVNSPTGGHVNTMYTFESGSTLRRLKPILTSVKMVNDGGSDYMNAYIYNVTIEFKVFTLEDLDEAESAFLRIGAEIKLSAGWSGIRDNTHNRNEFLVNVYNYSFSLDADGGYNISLKCMSPAGIWPKEKVTSHEAKLDDQLDTSREKSLPEILMNIMLVSTTRQTGDTVEDIVDKKSDDNKLVEMNGWGPGQYGAGTNGMPKLQLRKRLLFWGAEIKGAAGHWYNDEELHKAYVDLEGIIVVINALLENTNSTVRYTIPHTSVGGVDPGGAEFPDIPYISSADPTKFILPHKYAIYEESTPGAVPENMDWSVLMTTGQPNGYNQIHAIKVELHYLATIYKELSDSPEKQGGVTMPFTYDALLTKLFADLEYNTGGMINIISVAPLENIEDVKTPTAAKPAVIQIVNRVVLKPAPPATIDPYVFKVIAPNSFVKSVSMETDFDSDTLMMASRQGIEGGSSNQGNLDTLYGDCTGSMVNPTIAQALKVKIFDLMTKIQDMKYAYSKGFDNTTVSSLADAQRTLMRLLATTNDPLAPEQTKEIIYPLNLSVTIDGIFGFPFMAPISVDRLPKVYRDKKRAYFSITSQEHSWDGQGGWETAIGTVMRINPKPKAP